MNPLLARPSGGGVSMRGTAMQIPSAPSRHVRWLDLCLPGLGRGEWAPPSHLYWSCSSCESGGLVAPWDSRRLGEPGWDGAGVGCGKRATPPYLSRSISSPLGCGLVSRWGMHRLGDRQYQ